MSLTLDDWAAVLGYWQGHGRDPVYLEIPANIAAQLHTRDTETRTPLTDPATVTPETPPAADEPKTPTQPKWKRKAYFDGVTCGIVGCSKASDGYAYGTKPTKGGGERLWFGPTCASCLDKAHPRLQPMTLAELAHQRNGASDLALVLDVEVGDVLKRLALAGIDEKGRPIYTHVSGRLGPADHDPNDENTVQQNKDVSQITHEAAARIDGTWITAEPVQIPTQYLGDKLAFANGVLQQLAPWHIQSQADMDYAATFLQTVKAAWKEVEAARKDIAKPLRDKIQAVQDYFKPALELLAQVEVVVKTKISEGSARAAAAQQAAYEAAQRAMQTGDTHAAALATQQAVQADIALAPSVTIIKKVVGEIVDYTQLPQDFWSWVPDPAKVQAAVDAGWREIPGCRIYEKDTVVSRST